MKPTETAVELLLKQMPLAQPTSNLDRAIFELTQRDVGDLSQLPPKFDSAGRFGWMTLVSTAVAATLVGLLIGQFVSIYPTPGAEIAGIRVPGDLAPGTVEFNRSRQIVPVKFNVAAFEMMHGHSRRAEFAHCTSCHRTDNRQEEAFEGWYYGDEALFKTHDFKGVASCSACHVFSDHHSHQRVRGDASDFSLPDLHGFTPDFVDSECSDCHAGSPG
jgi:hypothetical protein